MPEFTRLARRLPTVGSADGARSTDENNYLLNGIANNVNVIDFLDEISFVAGSAPDVISRAAGDVLEADTKPGTN